MWCTNKSPSAEYHGDDDDDDGDVDGDGDDDDDGHVGDGDGDVAPGGDRQPINDRPVQWVKQKQGSCMIMMFITSGVMMITSGVIIHHIRHFFSTWHIFGYNFSPHKKRVNRDKTDFTVKQRKPLIN